DDVCFSFHHPSSAAVSTLSLHDALPISALSAVPPGQVSSCTITVTYTPPAGATGAALNGSARLTVMGYGTAGATQPATIINTTRSEEHTSELQSRFDLVCRLLLEKKKNI